ncbi:hypothetical protein GCM10028807_57880 [Spirosoma daeguense]
MTPQRTERIYFDEIEEVSDGGVGNVGEPVEKWSTLANWKPLKGSRMLEANQTSLRQGYVFTFWVDKRYEPQTGSIIRFRDEKLTVQEFRYTDETRRRYELIALEGNG